MKRNSRHLQVLALAASLSILASCSKDSKPTSTENELQAANIVGGKAATDDFQKNNGIVALVINTADGQGICSGTLIDKRLILTAAHCLDSSRSAIKSVAVVFAPDLSKATKEQVRFGIKGRPHQDFLKDATPDGKGSWNDIALIKLNEDAPADFKVVSLPTATTRIAVRAKLVQAGYGKTEAARNASGDTSGVLRQVSGIELSSLSEDGKELMLNENGKGSCNGDSGGPAFIRGPKGSLVQVGIDSRGTETDTCLGTGIYTNVAAHLDWIKSQSDLLLKAQ